MTTHFLSISTSFLINGRELFDIILVLVKKVKIHLNPNVIPGYKTSSVPEMTVVTGHHHQYSSLNRVMARRIHFLLSAFPSSQIFLLKWDRP
jgi:hypothetical protein